MDEVVNMYKKLGFVLLFQKKDPIEYEKLKWKFAYNNLFTLYLRDFSVFEQDGECIKNGHYKLYFIS
jgi:hypothetical protein